MVQRRTARRGAQTAGDRATVTSASHVYRDAIVIAMHDGSYERNEQDFIRLVVRPGMHVGDVGAHIGFHTTLLATLVDETGSVTAFEPVVEHADVLADTIRARGWESRVRLVRAAAGDVCGTRPMVIGAPELASANAYFHIPSGPPMRPSDDNAVTLRQVPVVTLDDAMSKRPIGFLKIDAEGAEALVLRGARSLLAEDRPIVLADLHPPLIAHFDGTTAAALIREMAGLGYECRLFGAGVPGPAVADVQGHGGDDRRVPSVRRPKL